MNTVAWMINCNRDTFVLALHGDVALLVKGTEPGDVWQFRRREGVNAAIKRIVHETSLIEEDGGDVHDPVEFDLSPEAIDQIRPHAQFQDWVHAPNLHGELMTAVEDPPCAMFLPPPLDWVPVGYVAKGGLVSPLESIHPGGIVR